MRAIGFDTWGGPEVLHPVTLPEAPINVFWHARNHREPANQWLRQVVVDEFAD